MVPERKMGEWDVDCGMGRGLHHKEVAGFADGYASGSVRGLKR